MADPSSTVLRQGLDNRRQRAARLHQLLSDAVASAPADAILLSGGLDTSILAALASAQGHRLKAFTVCVAGAPSPDEPFAQRLARRLAFEQQVLRPSLPELVERMPEVVRVLKTFDPMDLRNSIVTYLALEAASANKVNGVLTGDAADELFAGYSYMFNMPAEPLSAYRPYLNDVMHFTSVPIGEALGIRVELPYLNPAVRSFALTLDVPELVGEEKHGRCGKKILREAFSGLLPEDVIWRVKTPIESGSGSTELRRLAAQAVTDDELERARQRVAEEDGVRLREKEQYTYYLMYRRIFPPPRELPRGPKACGDCGGPVQREDMRYCRICGAYPV